MGSAIPIQSPHIDPPIFQRMGGEEGLAPLIQALEFYKTSKLQEQKNATEAAGQQSRSALEKAQTDALNDAVKRKQDDETAWGDFVKNAPATLQPFLQMTNALRGLPPEVAQVAGPIIAKAISQQAGMRDPIDPKQITGMADLMRVGVDFGTAAHMSGINLRDAKDKNPADPSAIPVDGSWLKYKYVPPSLAGSDLSRDLRAQGQIINVTRKQIGDITKDIQKHQQEIADQFAATANAGRPPLPGTPPPKYDPSQPGQAQAFHQFLAQTGYVQRLQQLKTDQDAAMHRMNDIASQHAMSQQDPATDQLQRVVDLMSKPQSPPQP